MGAGYVGILSIELHFPEARSLKGKRKYVKSAKAQLQQRFGASVAEVDHHELWQRSRLTLSCVSIITLPFDVIAVECADPCVSVVRPR